MCIRDRFQIIRQFTFHRPKETIQPTVWLFLSQACSMLPAILAYMAIYTLGPVSYTHLDVYKRQTYAFAVGSYNIDKEGTLTGPENPALIESLKEQGFIAAE